MCKGSKKDSIMAPFFKKNRLYDQNFVFFEVLSLKYINFVAQRNATNN